MHWQYTPYTLPLLLAAIISTALAFMTWRRRAADTRVFNIAMLIIAAWSIGYALELEAVDLPAKIFWGKIQYLGIATVPVVWLLFVMQFTGQSGWLKNRYLIWLFAIPLATIFLVWSNEWHKLIWTNTELDASGPFLALKVSYGPWFWVHSAFSYLSLLSSTILLINMLWRSTHLYRWQTSMLLFAAIIPWVGNGLYISGFSPIPNLDLTPFTFTLFGLAIVWAFYRFRLLDILPIAHKTVIDTMSDGVFVLDNQNRIVEINPAAQYLLDRAAAQVIGQQATQILSPWPALFQGRDLTLERQADISLNDSRGQRYLDARITPFYNHKHQLGGRLIVVRDITERKQMEQAWQESEEKFRTLAETASAAIIIHQGAEFLYANPAAETISGYSQAELLRLKFWEIVHPDFQDMIKERGLARLRRATPPQPFEIKIIHKSGQERWVYLTAGVIEFLGEPAIIATVVDITPLKEAETKLWLAHREAMAASQLKTQLLANVSHDLRTPLNAILGYTEMLQQGVFGRLSDQQFEATTEIIDSTGHVLNFVNNLLNQAQIEAGHIAFNHVPFAPRQLLDDAHAVLGMLARVKDVKVTYDVAADVPNRLVGDPYWLRQILINLISNAIKYTEQGAVTVFVYQPTPNHWGIRVADTGYGIPPEAQAYIFDPFRQVDSTTLRTHGGSGLGLSIVKQLTELMGGQINLESEVGRGSTFTVWLPLEPTAEEIV